MSGQGLGQYLRIWRVPGAPLLLVGGVVARLGQGVTILAWLLLIRETTGSFAQGALVGACTSLATAGAAPVAGRLADRFGAARVLPCYAAVYSLSQLGLLAAVLARAPLGWLCLLAALSGTAFPAITPALRAVWTVLTSQESGRADARTAAMAAESTLFELVFVAGPLVFSGFVLLGGPLGGAAGAQPAVAGPAAALATAALCTCLGTLALARGRAMRALRPTRSGPRARGLGPLREPGLPSLLVCAAGVAFSFGGAPVAIAAFSKQHDGAAADSVTGVLIAVWSIGSALAGFWYGTRNFRTPLPRQFVWLLAGLAVGYALWALMPGSFALALLLFCSGAVIAPALTVAAGLVSRLTPEHMLNEAYTWLTTTNLSAAALGAAVTGVLVDRPNGPVLGFVAAALAAGGAAAVAARPGAFRPPPAAPAVAASGVPDRRPAGSIPPPSVS